MSLAGEVALVTGASRGIGLAIAIALGKKDAVILGTATSQEGADRFAARLGEQGISGQGEVLNVADGASVDALFSRIKDRSLLPTILVNNAGITRDNLLARMQEGEWDDVINTNLNSLYRMSRACMRHMMKARKGRIINITSVVGATGNPGQANYCAAKAGVIGFTKALAREVGSRGITVNAVAPGFIETDMTRDLTEEQRRALVQEIPLNRLGSAEDVAAAVVFLASPAADYITGETLHVNGGMHMA